MSHPLRLSFGAWALLTLAGFAATSTQSAASPDSRESPSGRDAIKLSVVGPEPVGRFERIEFQVQAEESFRNACDPDEVELNLEVATPSGRRLTVPGFFHQPFEQRTLGRDGRRSDWMYPAGRADWRVRFASEESGAHTARATMRTRSGTRASEPVRFTVTAKTAKGWVQVARRDPRFFEFADGTPFFPIGQNVAFIGSGQYLDVERAIGVFRKMAENGATFSRVWACCEDWAMAIEARKSAWGRSWNWNPPFVPAPGGEGYHSGDWCARLGGTNASSVSLSPSHPVALRAGTEYRLAGRALTDPETGLLVEVNRNALGEAVRSEKRGQWTDFKRPFTAGSNQWWLGEVALRVTGNGRVWLKSLSLREAAGGPELLGEADPQRPPRGVYNLPDSFMLDRLVEAAERHGIYLQLCLFTRDHYMHALRDPASAAYGHATGDARKLLRYAIARWGYSSHVFAWEYFNEMDPGAPTEPFHRDLGRFLEEADPYHHLRTTSGWGPAPQQWHHPQLDVADLHWYLRPASKPDWRDEVAAVLDRAALVRSHATNKPAVLGEFGLADDKWGRSPQMLQDKEGVHVHNALWASAFSGLAAAASFWWWETLDQQNAYRHYRPLAAYLAGEPLTAAGFQAVTLSTSQTNARVLAWKGRERVLAWVFNPQATWWNQVESKQSSGPVEAESFALNGLTPATYRIEWWDTRSGQVVQTTSVVSRDGSLAVLIPNFTADIACKVVKQTEPK